MRIDLPLCNLKTCRYCFDGNCSNKNKHDACEYAFLKSSKERILERLEEVSHEYTTKPSDLGFVTKSRKLYLNDAIEIVKEEMR